MTKEKLNQLLDKLYSRCLVAYNENEVPISTILYIESKDKIIIRSNKVEKYSNPLYHSELLAINYVIKKYKIKYLKDVSLICSLEPCLMCLGAILKTQIKNVYYISSDLKEGSLSFYHTYINRDINIQQIKDERFDNLLSDFFKKIRNEKDL